MIAAPYKTTNLFGNTTRAYCITNNLPDLTFQENLIYSHLMHLQEKGELPEYICRGSLTEFGEKTEVGRKMHSAAEKMGYSCVATDIGYRVTGLKKTGNTVTRWHQGLVDKIATLYPTRSMGLIYKLCAASIEYWRRHYQYGKCYLGSLAKHLGVSKQTIANWESLIIDPWEGKPPAKFKRKPVDKARVQPVKKYKKPTTKTPPIKIINKLIPNNKRVSQQAAPIAAQAVDNKSDESEKPQAQPKPQAKAQAPKKPRKKKPAKQSRTATMVSMGYLIEHDGLPGSRFAKQKLNLSQRQALAWLRDYAKHYLVDTKAEQKAVSIVRNWIYKYNPAFEIKDFELEIFECTRDRGVKSSADLIGIGIRALQNSVISEQQRRQRG